jgi:hypothetical protein
MNSGSFLANAFHEKRVLNDDIEPITRIMGIPQFSFKEFHTSNITDFNASIQNSEGVTVTEDNFY